MLNSNKNIYLNDLHNKVTAYCLALSDHNKNGQAFTQRFLAWGYSHHDSRGEFVDFGKTSSLVPIGLCKKDGRRTAGLHWSHSRLPDRCDLSSPSPFDFISKIDVDGFLKIIGGHRWNDQCFAGLLDLKTVFWSRSLLDSPSKSRHHRYSWGSLGWKFSWDQLRCENRTNKPHRRVHQGTSARRRTGVLNYIFYRNMAYRVSSRAGAPLAASHRICSVADRFARTQSDRAGAG